MAIFSSERSLDGGRRRRIPDHRNFRNLHAYARRGETPPLDERLQYKFQSTAVTERCALLAGRNSATHRPRRDLDIEGSDLTSIMTLFDP